jgi:serine/threonine-protein kinase
LNAIDEFELPSGRLIGNRYRVLVPLGAGAMGSVYSVTDQTTGETVAIKILRSHLSGNQELIERLRREALATSKIRHPNVVRVIDFARTAEGLYVLVMEQLRGHDLARHLVAGQPLDPMLAIEVSSAVLGALWVAHEVGVVHRDIKPANIFLVEEEGTRVGIKVLDFGMAQDVDAREGLTRAGDVIGTPLYMAPEQAQGEKVDARADLYTTACVAYQLFTGQPPFVRASAYMTMLAHVEDAAEPVSSLVPGLPSSLDALMTRALAKDPARRFQTAAQMIDALTNVARDLGVEEQQFLDQSLHAAVSLIESDKPSWRKRVETVPRVQSRPPPAGAPDPDRLREGPQARPAENLAATLLDPATSLSDTVRRLPPVVPTLESPRVFTPTAPVRPFEEARRMRRLLPWSLFALVVVLALLLVARYLVASSP